MNDKRNRSSYLRVVAASLVAAAMLSASASSAQTILGTFSTSGVYDEQVTNEASPGGTGGNFLNSVDLWAAGNNIAVDPAVTPTGPTSYTQFQADILSAYQNNKGGVISFDNDTNAIGQGANAFVALVGANQATQLTVTRVGGTLNNNNNHNVISGFNYLGFQVAPSNTLAFSLPLETFAITGLGRGTVPAMTLSIIYDNGTEHTFPQHSMGVEVTGDSLFAWKAPAPRTISAVRFDATAFVRYDDLAVILANFQPGDADGDLDVDAADYNAIRDNFGLTPATKAQGDVTGDGVVNILDFQLWKANEAVAATPGAAAVPEPAGLAMAAIGILAAVRRRRR